MDIKRLQALVVDALEDVKAQEIALFDTMHLTALFDRLAIASGTSNRQTKALAASVRDKVKSAGGQVVSVEGEDTGEWVLVDLGDMIVHIMQPAIRAYYRLEEIWGDKPIKIADAKRGLKAKAEAEGESKPRRRAISKAESTEPAKAPAKPRARKTAAASEEDAPKRAAKRATKSASADSPKVPAKKTARKTAAKPPAARSPAKSAAKSASKSAKPPVGKTVKVAASKSAKPARKTAASR